MSKKKQSKELENGDYYKRPILYPDVETQSNTENVYGFQSMMTFYFENDRILNLHYARAAHLLSLARTILPDSKQDKVEEMIDKIREKYRNGLYPPY